MNFKKNDEGFICKNCGREVLPLGYTSRNHCPHCLYSLHVDVLPGDRANACGGFLKPVSVVPDGKKGYVIEFICEKCGAVVRNKAAKDDDFEILLKIGK